ncbi:UDP-galactose/UDP-glucose transporter 3 [Dichanthelium oligosanthes]|uniref:UDP-galactose/UDP-glucose transporter 3 n=1 Tax=Dichanthelium oligosanthes TaxID=888268 RepID=A0A1E5VD32_9POAL|nr:UDP-galactose/UDP-glucose transporter 3 [Dichanthelium oligosanthes]
MSSQVRVLNISHVRPVQTAGLPPPPAQGEHKLSFMDLLQISKTIQRLFFFDGPDLPPFPSVVSALRSSLAATLAVFLPLAGELAFRPGSGDVVIDFSPAAISSSPGVRFVEAEFAGGADAMRRLGRDDAHDTGAFASLVPELDAGRLPAPVLAVQVTRPAGGGGGGGAVAVGVSIRHAVADGHAVWQFLRAWSAASREGPGALAAPGFVWPTFDRAGIRHPKSAELVRTVLSRVAPALPLVALLLDEPPQLRSTSSKPEIMQQSRRTFLLRADEIRSLKQQILAQSRVINRGEPCKPPSTYVAISSLAWASIARAKLTMLDADDAHLMVSADCRNRLRPPLGDGFFGTCVKPCFARASAGDLRGEAGAARAAAAIQGAIRASVEELEGDPLSDAEGWVAAYGAIPQERFVAVGASHRFTAYETDFGWGGPSRVELVSLFVGQMVTLLGARDGGVQVSVALDAAAMEAFAANFVVPAAGVHFGVQRSPSPDGTRTLGPSHPSTPSSQSGVPSGTLPPIAPRHVTPLTRASLLSHGPTTPITRAPTSTRRPPRIEPHHPPRHCSPAVADRRTDTMASARRGRGGGAANGVIRPRPRDRGDGGGGSMAGRVAVLAFCVAGIWSAYIYQGVLQETLSTKRFGPEARRFEHLAFLNFAQNVVCFVWSFLMIMLWSGGSSSAGRAPLWKYWGVSVTNTIGPTMGIEALKYISYPAQVRFRLPSVSVSFVGLVLAKSSKMIPVMLMGTLLYGVKYTFPEYLCTFLVAGGVSSFALLKVR